MKRFFVFVSAVLVVSISGFPTAQSPTASAASNASMTIVGRIKNMPANTELLLVSNGGTTIKVAPSTSGSFTIKIPSTLRQQFSPGKGKVGSSIHILKVGKYAGPVLLGKKSKTIGYSRLSPTAKGKFSIGLISLATFGGTAKAKTSVLDLRNTVRLKNGQVVAQSVRSMADLSAKDATIGGDADKDGQPNFADPDMNGDGVLDAAQTDGKGSFDVAAAPNTSLGNRPQPTVKISKILSLNDVGTPVNSNVAPVSEEVLRAFLATNMSLELAVQGDDAYDSTTVDMKCDELNYCKAGGGAQIIYQPGSGWDQKSFSDGLLNTDGSISFIKATFEKRFSLHFKPGFASGANNNLSGDTFTVNIKRNGQVVSSEVKTVTSSVVAPPAWAAINGSPLTQNTDSRNPMTYTSAELSAMRLEMFRPQTLQSGSRSNLLDRGGMFYQIYLMPFGGGNGMWKCLDKDITNLTSTLARGKLDSGGTLTGVYDSEVSPTANGTRLGFTVNVQGCLSNPSSPAGLTTPTTGATLNFEVSATDSDGNVTRTHIYIKAP